MNLTCPNCGDPLYPFKPKWWKSQEELLLCHTCWHKYVNRDGVLVRVKKPIKKPRWAHKR